DAILPSRMKFSHVGGKVAKLAELLSMNSGDGFYADMMSYWKNPEELVLGSRDPRTLLRNPAQWPRFEEYAHLMMYLDTRTYLADDILAKVDRASMAVSLESRAPLLDHELIEFAWTLPLSLKIR